MTEQEMINRIPEEVWACLAKAPLQQRYAMLKANLIIYFGEKQFSFRRLAIYEVLKSELDRRAGK